MKSMYESRLFHPDYKFEIYTNFSDKRFLKVYEKAKRTFLRLKSKGELYKIRAYSKHKGWGNYEYSIVQSYLPAWDKELSREAYIPRARQENEYTVIDVELYQPDQKKWYEGKVKFNPTSYKLYVESPYGGYELYAEGDEAKSAAEDDAHRFQYSDVDIFEIIAFQQYKKDVSDYYKDKFTDELIEWRVGTLWDIKMKCDTPVNERVWQRCIYLSESGRFTEAKSLLESVVKYGFARHASRGKTSDDSQRQLRALGFVA